MANKRKKSSKKKAAPVKEKRAGGRTENQAALPARKKNKEGPVKQAPNKKVPPKKTAAKDADKGPGLAATISQFFREVRIELKKVTWPSRKETLASTSVVLVLVFLVAIFLGLVDIGLSRALKLILR
jgi:preprotein translocase subunit SecE